MPWRLGCIFLAFLCLVGLSSSQNNVRPLDFGRNNNGNGAPTSGNSNRNYEFDTLEFPDKGGSGDGTSPFTDDEDFGESGFGSGSGSGMGDFDGDGSEPAKTTPRKAVTTTRPTTTTTTTPAPSLCQIQRRTHKMTLNKFIPRCDPNGEFSALQCNLHPGTSDCWCVDLRGVEVPGTNMEAPNFPSCDDGDNLPPCVHQVVQHMRGRALLGAFKPRCTVDGQFLQIQCQGSMCYCVDENSGQMIDGTQVQRSEQPDCDGPIDGDNDNIDIPEKEDSEEGDIEIDNPGIDRIDIDFSSEENDEGPGDTIDLDLDESAEKDKEDKFGEDNGSNTGKEGEIGRSGAEHHNGKVETASEIMTQPGILAGIIGGSVVLLLCLVLLVMFIIYRMRKKDEGSYPLDEPRKPPNYSYVRAPEKEFYA